MSLCLAIATCDRSDLLAGNLQRISELTLPDELIVVDDGGTDDCERVCREAPIPVRYIYTHHLGKQMCSHARNVALKATDCELFMTSEPEMYFETDIVAQFLAKHAELPGSMLNAATIHHEHPDWNPPQVTTTTNWEATWVAMYGRQWLLDIGGWDEHFPDPWGFDDIDLVTRICFKYGNHKLTEAVATHRWHPPAHISQVRNEAYFQSKMDANRCMQVVANVGHEWGVVKPR